MLPKCKFGDCSKCGAKDTNVVKIKRELFCLTCNREIKIKQYEANSREKSKVRLLGKEQVRNGDYFQAERAALIQDLDFVASRICRLTAADSNGMVKCYTCPSVKHWSLMEAGHFVSRGDTQVRWDLRRNIRPQCHRCNSKTGLDGNLKEFAAQLELEQSGLPETLIELSREPYKWSREELKMLLIDLRAKYNLIEKDKK